MHCQHNIQYEFDVHVTVHRVKFLTINQLNAQFLKFILGMKIYMFRTVPLSIIRCFSLYTQQWYMSYRFADSLQQLHFHPNPACKLSENLYDIYHSYVYSENLLMMDRGTVRNM
jgi:hypothetical protein